VGGYFLYHLAAERRQQAAPAATVVPADSIAAYQARLVQLKGAAARLRVRLAAADQRERGRLERTLGLLESEISELSAAVEQWRSASGAPAQANLYQRCVLMYGRASGVCDALAEDTLPPVSR
jgi:hypothetical protein